MGRQRAVDLVELLAAGGCDGQGDSQIVALFAVAQFDRVGVKSWDQSVSQFGSSHEQTRLPWRPSL